RAVAGLFGEADVLGLLFRIDHELRRLLRLGTLDIDANLILLEDDEHFFDSVFWEVRAIVGGGNDAPLALKQPGIVVAGLDGTARGQDTQWRKRGDKQGLMHFHDALHLSSPNDQDKLPGRLIRRYLSESRAAGPVNFIDW